MKKRKSLFALFSIILFLSTIIAGCGFMGEEEDKGKVDQTEVEWLIGEVEKAEADPLNYEGKIKIFCDETYTSRLALEAFAESFNEKFPKIDVEIEFFASSNYQSMIQSTGSAAAILGDHSLMPDLFSLSQTNIALYYTLDLLKPLSQYIESDNNFDLSELSEDIVRCSQKNGVMYMMPRDYNQVIMYYNKDMLLAAGVDLETEIYNGMSKEDFLALCQKLKTNLANSNEVNDYGKTYKSIFTQQNFNDTKCTIFDVSAHWDAFMWPLVKAYDGKFVDENLDVYLDTQEVYDAFDFWYSMIANDYSYKVNAISDGALFIMQQAPLYAQSRSAIKNITTPNEEQGIIGVTNLGAVALPQFGPNYTYGGGSSGYAMYKNAQNPVEAWLFLKHMVSIEGQNAFSETGLCVPVLKELLNDEDAIWRNYTGYGIDSTFDHSIFIYRIDDGPFVNIDDFTKFIPLESQHGVWGQIQSAFINFCNKSTSEDDKWHYLEFYNEAIYGQLS